MFTYQIATIRTHKYSIIHCERTGALIVCEICGQSFKTESVEFNNSRFNNSKPSNYMYFVVYVQVLFWISNGHAKVL